MAGVPINYFCDFGQIIQKKVKEMRQHCDKLVFPSIHLCEQNISAFISIT